VTVGSTGTAWWLRPPADSRGFMLAVLQALAPGLLLQCALYGSGPARNVVLAAAACIGAEAAALHLRGRPPAAAWRDGSALVTALLLAGSLPPQVSAHVVVTGGVFAILLGKQAFGGLGENPFNPAMVGYVVVLLAYPGDLAHWPAPAWTADVDAWTGATALDVYKHRGALLPSELAAAHAAFGGAGGAGTEWVNAAWLCGGAWLLGRRVITWHAPAGMLAALALSAALGYRGDSAASLGSPLLHLFAGGTMLAAFFVVTDPVSGPASRRGQFVFGAGVGLLTFAIRAFGAHADGIAFAVLLMNAATPLIDRWLLARGARW
jgi:electron transport complex protein RnfD